MSEVAPAGTGRLRVVHVIDSLAGSGGAENRLVEEVLALGERCDHVVVRLFEQGFLDDKLAAAGIPVLPLGFAAGRAARTWPLVARRLRAVLRRERPDVVHTSLVTGNLVGQLAAAPLGIPVVSTFNRTGDVDQLRRMLPGAATWKAQVMRAVGRAAARRGDVHHRAVGRHALETNCAAMRLAPDTATVVPRGVEVGDVAPADRAALGVPADVPLVANVARLVPEKAQHLLVAAFAAARAELPGAHLVIAGASGPAEPAVVAAVAEHGLGDAVHLLGFRSDARSIVAAADVFAFSSLSEGSPGAVVEALRLGTPVAAFDIAPVAELTGDGEHAWLAPAGAVDALAKAIVAAATAPDRAPRAEAGRVWATERYSLDAVADQLHGLLAARAAGAGTRATTGAAATTGATGATGGAGSAAGRDRGGEATVSAARGGAASGDPVALERGAFVVSIDTEMAWGGAHLGEAAASQHDFAREREVVNRTLGLFERHGITATWAIVGHLFLERCEAGPDGTPHPGHPRPAYPWLEGRDWLGIDPCTSLADDPYFYGRDMVEIIRGCDVTQEVACHGFSHVMLGDEGCSAEVADAELGAAADAARTVGAELRSFVFPRNSLGHLDRLAAHGYVSYRGSRPRPPFAGRPAWQRTALRAVDRARPLAGSAALPARHASGVWNVPQTYLFAPATQRPRTPVPLWVRRPVARLRQAARHRGVFHLWFHPYNLTADPDRALAALDKLCAEAARLRDAGRLDVVTMGTLADRLTAAGAGTGAGAAGSPPAAVTPG